MDRNFLAALAIVALVAGGALYFLNAAHEQQAADLRSQRDSAGAAHAQQIAELRKQVEQAEARARAAADLARRREAELKASHDAARAARERAVAAEKSAAERIAAAEKAAREAVQRAAAAERAATPRAAMEFNPEALYKQALALEQEGQGWEAVKLYVRAARSGSGKAAFRLGEIYDKGIPGVGRNYAESLKWFNAARVLGEDVPPAKSR